MILLLLSLMFCICSEKLVDLVVLLTTNVIPDIVVVHLALTVYCFVVVVVVVVVVAVL